MRVAADQGWNSKLERVIGVIWRPETELLSQYARCSLSDQFDGLVWFDRTSAVTPLTVRRAAGEEEIYPFGLRTNPFTLLKITPR